MKQQEKEKEYETYVKEKTPVRKPGPAMAKAFVTGGIICTIGQTILNACEKAGMSKDISASWCSLILILYGVFTSWVLGLLYWIGTLIGIV